jgi:dCMP deaminase
VVMRIDLHHMFMEMAVTMSKRSSCLSRQVGCVMVDGFNHLLSTGYNGPPSGVDHCIICKRAHFKSAKGLDQCMAVHAEQNALLQCKDIQEIQTVYVTASPCLTCVKLLLNTQCYRIVFKEIYPDDIAERLWKLHRGATSWIHLST